MEIVFAVSRLDRERGSFVGLQLPKHAAVPVRRVLTVVLLGVTLLVLSGCAAADSTRSRDLAMPEPCHREGSPHLRPVEVGLGRRDGDRRHRLGPDLLGRRALPPSQRRRDPRADALQPAARDLLHDRADHDGDRLLLLDRQRAGRADRARARRPTSPSTSSASSGPGRSTTASASRTATPTRSRTTTPTTSTPTPPATATRSRRWCCRSTRPSSSTCTRPT